MTHGETGRLAAELRSLLAETNDQRRRVGQALYHLYRTLYDLGRRGETFAAILSAWAPAAADSFHGMAHELARIGPHAPDVRLRAFLAPVLRRLAEDLRRGEAWRVPFLRHLESRFPILTDLMRAEPTSGRCFDHSLVVDLARAFDRVGWGDPGETTAETLESLAQSLEASKARPRAARGRGA